MALLRLTVDLVPLSSLAHQRQQLQHLNGGAAGATQRVPSERGCVPLLSDEPVPRPPDKLSMMPQPAAWRRGASPAARRKRKSQLNAQPLPNLLSNVRRDPPCRGAGPRLMAVRLPRGPQQAAQGQLPAGEEGQLPAALLRASLSKEPQAAAAARGRAPTGRVAPSAAPHAPPRWACPAAGSPHAAGFGRVAGTRSQPPRVARSVAPEAAASHPTAQTSSCLRTSPS